MKEENQKVKIVMDFDGTLSYGRRKDGKKNSSIASLRDGGYLSEYYDKAAHALHDKYYPIEKDYTLSHDEKLSAMHEWWDIHSQLLIDSGLTSEIMERAGRSHYVQLRVGIKEFFNFLKENNIDAYVFTAGRRDLIYYTLLEEGIKIDEDHIIGNYFIYATEADVKASEANEENIKIKVGDAIDYNRPQITSMDKDDSVILNKDNHMYDGIRDDYATASTTIILGDGEGDTSMVKNRENNNAKENIFRIGFFNMSPDEAHYAERLARFKSIYDVVLPADASLSEVAEIIKRNKTIL